MSKPKHKLTHEDRDARVLDLYNQLIEIEQRLIPTGLHVFGRPSKAGEKADLLRLIASFDRPEANARSIVDLVTTALTTAGSNAKTASLSLKERVDELVAATMRRFVERGQEEAESFLKARLGSAASYHIRSFSFCRASRTSCKQMSSSTP